MYQDAVAKALNSRRELELSTKNASSYLLRTDDIENRGQAAQAIEIINAQNDVISGLCNVAEIGSGCISSLCEENDAMRKKINEFSILYKYRKTLVASVIVCVAMLVFLIKDISLLKILGGK